MDQRLLSQDYWLLVAQVTIAAKQNPQTLPSHVSKTCIDNWKSCVSCCDHIPSIKIVLDVGLPPSDDSASQRAAHKTLLNSVAERCMRLDANHKFARDLVILAFAAITPLARWHVQYFVKKLQIAVTKIMCVSAHTQQDLLLKLRTRECVAYSAVVQGTAKSMPTTAATILTGSSKLEDPPSEGPTSCSASFETNSAIAALHRSCLDGGTVQSRYHCIRLLGSIGLSCPCGLTQVAGLLQVYALSNERHSGFAAASALMDGVYLNIALVDGGWQDFLLDMVSSFIAHRSLPHVQFTAVVCATRLLMFKSDWCEATGNVEAILEDIIDQRQVLTAKIKNSPKEPPSDAPGEEPFRLPEIDDSKRQIDAFLRTHSQNCPDHIANGCVYQICKALKSGVLLICPSKQYGLRIEDNVAKQSEADRLTNACRCLFSLLCSHEVPIPLGDVFEAIRKNLYQTNLTAAGIEAWVIDKGLIP